MKHTRSEKMDAGPTAFTLIELLVVIAIIAILVTGACAAFTFAIEKARMTDAQSTARTLVNAVEEFQKEYDRMPTPVSATEGRDCESDTSAAEGLLLILTGKDKSQNPRGNDLLGDLKEATTVGKGRRVDGLVRNGETIELLDPWGSVFKVTLDLDADGIIQNPNQDEQNEGTKELHKSVIVYSAGRDGDFSTWKDNVTSWRAK